MKFIVLASVIVFVESIRTNRKLLCWAASSTCSLYECNTFRGGIHQAMKTEYKSHNRVPTLEEYRAVCVAVGWEKDINFGVVEASLEQSLFGVVIQHQDGIVGMGRVVGDGKIYFYIQDVAVMPEHQGKGVGGLIMEEISNFLKNNAPEKSFVGLFASQGKEQFYTQYGFQQHEGMTGMFGVVHEGKIK